MKVRRTPDPAPQARALASLTMAEMIDDPVLLGPYFAGESWNTWRAILKAANAESLTDDELALFKAVAGRAPPSHRVKELIVIAGRRSGKDSIASAIATTAAIADYGPYLRPGERASVLCLAVDREQAKIVRRYIGGYFATVPLLHPLVAHDDDDVLELSNGVEIVVATNSFRAVRGRTVACAIFDEAAFWRDETSATPDTETYNAVLPAMITLPGALLIVITTAYRRKGLAYTKWQKHFGKDDDDVLVIYGPSTAFNPKLPQSVIDKALENDPEAAGAEYLSEWRSDLSDFLDRELVEAAIERGVLARPPQSGIQYAAFADPSGGRGDSFTLAIAHAEQSLAVLDCLYEKRAPFEPGTAVAEISALLRSYGIAEVTGDKYAAQWVVEAFAAEGIAYRNSERDRSALYLDALPLFTAGRARLLDHARLVHQFVSLERRATRTGRDLVNHPSGGADDLANSAGGALVAVAADNVPSLIRAGDFLVNGVPVPLPTFCDGVFATLAVDETGRAAIVYWSRSRHIGYPLVLLDFDVTPFASAMFRTIMTRLDELAGGMKTQFGNSGIFAVEALVRQALALGIQAHGLEEITPEPEALSIVAAGHVSTGEVKIAEPAYAKAKRHPLGAALEFHVAKPDNPLALAALVGIVIALDKARAARAA